MSLNEIIISSAVVFDDTSGKIIVVSVEPDAVFSSSFDCKVSLCNALLVSFPISVWPFLSFLEVEYTKLFKRTGLACIIARHHKLLDFRENFVQRSAFDLSPLSNEGNNLAHGLLIKF